MVASSVEMRFLVRAHEGFVLSIEWMPTEGFESPDQAGAGAVAWLLVIILVTIIILRQFNIIFSAAILAVIDDRCSISVFQAEGSLAEKLDILHHLSR